MLYRRQARHLHMPQVCQARQLRYALILECVLRVPCPCFTTCRALCNSSSVVSSTPLLLNPKPYTPTPLTLPHLQGLVRVQQRGVQRAVAALAGQGAARQRHGAAALRPRLAAHQPHACETQGGQKIIHKRTTRMIKASCWCCDGCGVWGGSLAPIRPRLAAHQPYACKRDHQPIQGHTARMTKPCVGAVMVYGVWGGSLALIRPRLAAQQPMPARGRRRQRLIHGRSARMTKGLDWCCDGLRHVGKSSGSCQAARGCSPGKSLDACEPQGPIILTCM